MVTSTKTKNADVVMHKTYQPLEAHTREKVIPILNQSVADASDLYFQIKQAHWNVRGPDFIALHKLFDDVAEEVIEYIDDLAERIAQLGGQVHGTLKHAAQTSSLSDYPLDLTDSPGHVKALSEALSHFSNEMRLSIEKTDQMEDPVTADLYTQIGGKVDKWLWFIEAHNM
ncbi:DNA starvation/stationary phase protection protein Dps [Poriferisphaera sp. WC338]|uniref:DNA starvation/stationary phase protection protein Dps n=1 Tax=Poriferisphaera sp. WC338 TaxID=3425129 RepID=UPI003D81C3D7